MKYKFTIEADTQEELENYINANNYYAALWEIYHRLRNETKHGKQALRTSAVYEEFWNILRNEGVELI